MAIAFLRSTRRPRLAAPDKGKNASEIAEASICHVQVFRYPEWQPEAGELASIWIEFAGPLANIPSSSNTHVIRQAGNKRFVGRSSTTLDRLQAATWKYRGALMETGENAPSFLDTPVLVTALIAHKPGRWDDHNCTKFIGDWLQDVGIINDDQNAVINCYKKSRFPDRGDTQRFRNGFCIADFLKTTRIIIQPWAEVAGLIQKDLLVYQRISTGQDRVIG